MAPELLDFTFPHKRLFVRVFRSKAYLVGGAVRDLLIHGRIDAAKDIDFVVIDNTYEQIEEKLRSFGKTNTVGKSFAVVKFTVDKVTYDISVPRRDVKKSAGSHSHRNFLIDAGPHISLEEDLYRRDFTCNSIALRLRDNFLYDPFAGASAIRARKIIMTNPQSFSDDPLRVLRAARFAAALRFSLDPAIYTQAGDVQLGGLSAERVCDELCRLLLESPRPALGLEEYWKLTVLEKLFPELYASSLTIQDSRFHPERDAQGHHTVWAHTLIAIDVAKKLCTMFSLDEERSLALLLAALLHDIGKTGTTRWEHKRGRMTITSALHDSHGTALAEKVLDRLKIESRRRFPLKSTVLKLLQYHHRIYELYRNRKGIGFKAIARLVKDMEGEDFLLVLLDFADRRSRRRDPLGFADLDAIFRWYQKQKEKHRISQETIKPLVLGRDLLPLGVPPGRGLGAYLKKLYEMQLEGRFRTKAQGLRLFQEQVQRKTGK